MSLTGQLNDLSLAELIEFFCNQRKTGRLTVSYALVPGYFYFLRGELVDASLGSLHGVEAVYFAFTQENASFKFSTTIIPTRRNIHQPWASVALEGLRRMDEGITPIVPLIDEAERNVDPDLSAEDQNHASRNDSPVMTSFMQADDSSQYGNRKKAAFAGVAAAVALSVAAIGIPAGWYHHKAAPVSQPAPSLSTSQGDGTSATYQAGEQSSDSTGTAINAAAPSNATDGAALLKRERDAKEREKQRLEERANAADKPGVTAAPQSAAKVDPPKTAQKMVSVQVTYDENGRVTQTSGGDGTAQRIARQKHFPAGKAGSATVTIPIN